MTVPKNLLLGFVNNLIINLSYLRDKIFINPQ